MYPFTSCNARDQVACSVYACIVSSSSELTRAMHAIHLRVVYMRISYPSPQNLPRAMHAINLSCAAFGAVCVCTYMRAFVSGRGDM